jgi:hypothetical protein
MELKKNISIWYERALKRVDVAQCFTQVQPGWSWLACCCSWADNEEDKKLHHPERDKEERSTIYYGYKESVIFLDI